jgi:hypothetical protein
VIKRWNIDAMTKKLDRNTIYNNQGPQNAIDLASIVSYDPSKDDIQFYFDEEKGYMVYPSEVEHGHPSRKALKLKVFESHGIFILILGPSEEKEDSENVDNSK